MPRDSTILALSDVLASQRSLEEEAAAAIPHDFSRCTYPLGPIRQAVYLCVTCKDERGICSACSVSCHADHEQLELFPKRDFRCDCPTEALEHPCSLHTTKESINKDNCYGQNFHGKFCRCGRAYDAATERETMIQCVIIHLAHI
jgi:E3 ubiquitin-protein ligase UBR7